MKYTLAVSFPRSGHHLLVNCLARYFSRDLAFESRSLESGTDRSHFACGQFVYCEYYRHCQQIPCQNEATIYQKNHDFGLRLAPLDSGRYVVQFRDPLPAIASYYRLETQGRAALKDTPENWIRFATTNLSYWQGFVTKWTKRNSANVAVVKYEEFVDDIAGTLEKVLRFLSVEPHDDRVHAVANSVPERPTVEPPPYPDIGRSLSKDWSMSLDTPLCSDRPKERCQP